MKYIKFSQQGTVEQIYPEYSSLTGNLPLRDRIPPSIYGTLIPVEDDVIVDVGYLFVDGVWEAPEPVEQTVDKNPNQPISDTTPEKKTYAQELQDVNTQLLQADETSVQLYEELSNQEQINAAQDETLVQLFEKTEVV